jgi:hypothetical protein
MTDATNPTMGGEYRLMHDRHGDGASATGRAWDLMKRAGDKARAALTATAPPTDADEDSLVMLMLNELHSNMPEIDRPMSFSDLSDEQAERARKAVRAVVVAAGMSKPAGRWRSMADLEAHLACDADMKGGEA